jgi:hypothetical protein
MDKTITIQSSQVKPIASFLRDQQERILLEIAEQRKRIAELEKQYDANNATLDHLGVEEYDYDILTASMEFSSVRIISQGQTGYNPLGSWWDKIFYILKKEERGLKSKELLNLIYEHEPELNQVSVEERRKIEVNVFSTLTHKSKKNHLGRIRFKNEYVYGLTHWFTKEGTLKKQYYME